MNWRVVRALVAKDLELFFRNRFFAFVTVAGMAAYVAIYLVMPRTVNETLKLGLYAPTVPPALEQMDEVQGLALERFDSEETLREAVVEGEYPAGVVLPAGLMEKLAAGELVRVEVLVGPDVPEELEGAASALIQQFAYLQSGRGSGVEINRQVLGRDMVGQHVPPRDRMLPLLATFIMLVETLGLASLISEEVEGRTIEALLITPLTVRGLFLAKGLTGVGLAFSEVTLFMVATRSLDHYPLLLLAALFLGAVLVTGVSYLLGALGTDMMSVMAWGIPFLIIVSIPAFGVMFPGAISDWVRLIPSYYLVDTVHQAANLRGGWGDLWGNLVILMGFDVLFITLGVMALRRRFT
jgi:ABC-2 type transport system permease protein